MYPWTCSLDPKTPPTSLKWWIQPPHTVGQKVRGLRVRLPPHLPRDVSLPGPPLQVQVVDNVVERGEAGVGVNERGEHAAKFVFLQGICGSAAQILLCLFTLFYPPLLIEILASLLVHHQVQVVDGVNERGDVGVGVNERGEVGVGANE